MTDQNKKPPILGGDLVRTLEEIWNGITLRNAIVLMIALAYEREIKRLRRQVDMLDELLEDKNHKAK
jgi:hypothetical protein